MGNIDKLRQEKFYSTLSSFSFTQKKGERERESTHMYISIFIQYFTSKVRLIGKEFNKDIHNLSGRKE